MNENTRDLLFEIGTEELPPKSLARLGEALGEEMVRGLEARGLGAGEVITYATPRRIATLLIDVPESQEDREVERRGPALSVAFDADGEPTRAAEGFARSCGVSLEHLSRMVTDEGAWLVFQSTEVGEMTSSLLPEIVNEAVARLPVPRRMRWGDGDAEFARPVHWVVLLFGDEVVDAEVLGVRSGRMTRGHRFHHPEAIVLDEPASYAAALQQSGYVIGEFERRREIIEAQIHRAAAELQGRPHVESGLLDEVTALVEWPSAIVGSFEERFLSLPEPVLISTMQGHQRYFPVYGDDGRLMARFITISNIDSRNPNAVSAGNERVIRPRLADAEFFLETDLKTPLETFRERLDSVVYQEKLGSLADKSARVARLTGHVAIAMGEPPDTVKLARQAGELSKCDLLTEMVGEFPDLQGVMGREYAMREGYPEAVADALEEAYLPRFAGDVLPATAIGRALAIADRLDTLVGIFGIGGAPTGERDPFALRRQALGALRVIIEGELPLDLPKLLQAAADGFPDGILAAPEARRRSGSGDGADGTTPASLVEAVMAFMMDRLRGYFVDQEVPVDVFAAVQARQPTRPFDFACRVSAVNAFRQLPEAASLAGANKRIQNILRQAEGAISEDFDDRLFAEDAEWNLAAKLVGLGPRVREMLKGGDYTGALSSLAGLRDNVDEFFDKVKVMDDDVRVRANRLSLLKNIGDLFLETADISRLQA